MNNLKAFIVLLLVAAASVVKCNDNLKVAYEWKQINFQNNSNNVAYKKDSVIPVGLEVYKSRLFITLPRWKEGVPASLAYLNLNG